MNIIKNFSIRNKLFFIVLIPVIVLLYILISGLVEKVDTRNNIQDAHNIVQIGDAVSNIIVQLQIERGYTIIFLINKDVAKRSDMENKRNETDVSIDELKRLLDANNKDFETYSFLDYLPQLRDDIDLLQLSPDSVKSMYSVYTTKLLQNIKNQSSRLNDPEMKHMFNTMIYLLESRDFMSKLRAFLDEAILQKDFSSNQFVQFASLKEKFESYLEVFKYNAPAEIVTELNKKLSNPSVEKSIDLMDAAYKNADLSVLPTYDEWSTYASGLTPSFKDITQSYGTYVTNIAQSKLDDINRSVINSIIAAVLVLVIVGFLLFYTTRAIVTSLVKIRDAAELISEGNLDLTLSVTSRDEIGSLASSFEKMILVTKQYALAADKIGKGDYSTEVIIRNDNDGLGIALNNMKENLQQLSEENENRTWLLTGNSDLNDKIRGEKRVEELAQEIINFLTPYLKAQIGAIYISENGHLNLVRSYAFNQRKGNTNVVKIGEGLVGQAALEAKPIIFGDIPDDYIRINSGLGNTLPKNIVVYPLLYEGEVKGVIEIGTAKEFSELDKQFLNLVSENISIAINSSQSRDQLKALLEETQRQAEELEAQQEELRQANEELEEKTQMLEKSEAELKAQQEELQQTNEELEEKADLLESQKEKLEIAKVEIEAKARELEITSKYKSEFLANMSHELRTPLNSILILAQLMSENKNKTLSEKEVEFSRNIYNSGTDLLKLINEILDLSKVEAGRIELDISEVQIDEVIENMQATFNEIANTKSINFDITYRKENIKEKFFSDRERLEQILKNLLSNAFKFTNREGKVSMNIGLTPSNVQFNNGRLQELDKVIEFSVTDSGIGIPDHKQLMVFEAFQQADGSTKRKYGGTGLGLSISRELAHALGGEIHLKSDEGKGSTFTLYLPLKFDAKMIIPLEKEVQVTEKKQGEVEEKVDIEFSTQSFKDDRFSLNENDKIILILEDDENFAGLLLDLIRERGYKGIVTYKGNTGLSLARHYKPDAIILDMKLPVMDGAEVLKHLKNDPKLRHVPVQIISGYDRRKEGIELGAFGFLKKPLSKDDLRNAFDKMEDFINKKLKKLLVVEDDKTQNKAIKELIGNGDTKSYSAFSGEEAYKMLQKENFDCIIIDLGLPDVSGFELLEKIKANKKLVDIPIIVYTGRDLTKDEAAKLNKLANTVVLKTAESHERLLDETILFLHRVESKLPAEKQKILRKLHKTDEVLKNKKVLIVDDDMRNIYSITNVLEEEGLTCISAENGRESLMVLNDNPDTDIVLMDIMMPEMDGYEATSEIKKISKFSRLPIIALTAKAMKGDREKCLEVGMSDYIAKPVNLEQLLSLMRVWLYR
ncbi:MAG: response regulator [Ignavibacteria bacterium]|jgi:CheY-like chemotaxis protein/HAMP domain-containing protein